MRPFNSSDEKALSENIELRNDCSGSPSKCLDMMERKDIYVLFTGAKLRRSGWSTRFAGFCMNISLLTRQRTYCGQLFHSGSTAGSNVYPELHTCVELSITSQGTENHLRDGEGAAICCHGDMSFREGLHLRDPSLMSYQALSVKLASVQLRPGIPKWSVVFQCTRRPLGPDSTVPPLSCRVHVISDLVQSLHCSCRTCMPTR
jgi:hypothetical protein